MNTVIFAEEGSASTWGTETAPPDRRWVGTIEQRERGFYISPGGLSREAGSIIRYDGRVAGTFRPQSMPRFQSWIAYRAN